MSDKSGYFVCTQSFSVTISQAASATRARRFSTGTNPSSRTKINSDAITFLFKTSKKPRIQRTISKHPFSSRCTHMPTMSHSPPNKKDPTHDGPGPCQCSRQRQTKSGLVLLHLSTNAPRRLNRYDGDHRRASSKRALCGPLFVLCFAAPTSTRRSSIGIRHESGRSFSYHPVRLHSTHG